ncbi:MAG: methylenetetrahydrofolate reductase C-terminal domain-containing protein [Verrucomicrobiota bacterium]
MDKQNNQFNIPFSKTNPLAQSLQEAHFSIIIECDTPAGQQPFEPAVTPALNIAREAKKDSDITALAVTDRLTGENAYSPAALATRIAETAEKPVVVHFSGKGSTGERLSQELADAASGEVQNLLAVTGDRSVDHPIRHGLTKYPAYKPGYLDSIEIIRKTRESDFKFHIGAGVNPYKYNAADQYLQYYKMMRKIATGAQFIVTHIGWDMKKLQELQWFLQMRECGVPVLARTALLSSRQIKDNGEEPYPGITLSRPFAALLERECNINENQLLAAQLQRLGLQVAGCRLLGYSGIQIAGINNEQTLGMVMRRIRENLKRFTSYSDWLTAWQEFHGEIQFAPRGNSAFYAFTNLLDPEVQMYSPELSHSAYSPFPTPEFRDILRSRLLSFTGSRAIPRLLHNACISIYCRGCIHKNECNKIYTFHLCPRACPKHLVYGPCGGSKPDGICEFGHRECFFHRVLAVAARKHALDLLEEGIQ